MTLYGGIASSGVYQTAASVAALVDFYKRARSSEPDPATLPPGYPRPLAAAALMRSSALRAISMRSAVGVVPPASSSVPSGDAAGAGRFGAILLEEPSDPIKRLS